MADSEPAGCLYAILRLFGAKPPSTEAPAALPYQRKDFLLTRAERSFYGVLNDAVDDRYLIFTMVRLAVLVDIQQGTERRQGHMNRIQSKHIDFLVCDRAEIRPLLAIELDDKSHARADRVARDEFVDACLRAAGLPFLRVRARSAYNVEELREQVEEAISAPP